MHQSIVFGKDVTSQNFAWFNDACDKMLTELGRFRVVVLSEQTLSNQISGFRDRFRKSGN
jgi:hypothetical protein